MAITTYAELKASVAGWLNRPDLTAIIPDLIALAEADINRRLRCRQMLKRVSTTLDAAREVLPGDFLEAQQLVLPGPPPRLVEQVGPSQIPDLRARHPAGTALYYALLGDALEFVPEAPARGTLELTYYARLAALSDAAPSNAVLQAHPDLYLYATLAQSAPYLRDDARLTIWAGLYAATLDAIHALDRRAQWSGNSLTIRSS